MFRDHLRAVLYFLSDALCDLEGDTKMSLHQVRLRKGGPIHAVDYDQVDSSYMGATECGMSISPLDTPKHRLFPPKDSEPCKRCLRTTI